MIGGVLFKEEKIFGEGGIKGNVFANKLQKCRGEKEKKKEEKEARRGDGGTKVYIQ